MLTRSIRITPVVFILAALLAGPAVGQEQPPTKREGPTQKGGKGGLGKGGKVPQGGKQAAREPQQNKVPAGPLVIITDPADVNPEYDVIGEYVGDITTNNDEHFRLGLQIAYSGPKVFMLRVFTGGLPGDGYDDRPSVRRGAGRFENGSLTIPTKPGPVVFMFKDGQINVVLKSELIGWARKHDRISPAVGRPPPEGAESLFDGSSLEQLSGGELLEGGLLKGQFSSKSLFQDHSIHLEFRLPYIPDSGPKMRGMNRLMIQGRYELQIRDSLALSPVKDTCGYIVGAKNPLVNMSYPPLSWQALDVDFRAARFDAAGTLIEPARATVFLNGGMIYEDEQLPEASPLGLDAGPEPGPLVVSGDGCPVVYRNIWIKRAQP